MRSSSTFVSGGLEVKGNFYTISYAAILGTVCALLLTGVAVITKPFQERNEAAEKNRNIFTAVSHDFDKDATAEELVAIFNKYFEEKTSVSKLTDIFEETLKGNAESEDRILAFSEEVSAMASSEQIISIFKETIASEGTAEELAEAFAENMDAIDDRYPELTLYRYMDDSGDLIAVAVDFSGPGLWAPIKGILALEQDMKTIRGVTFYEQKETPGLGGEISGEDFRSRFTGKKIVAGDGTAGIVIKAGLKDGADNEIDGISGATMTIDKVSQMLNDVIAKVAN